MTFPKLTKSEALRLECVRVAPHDATKAKELYEFITASDKKPLPKPKAKPQR